ncbi:MAG: PfkB family carbohydrate kinase [Acidimicrobiia bacterium]|nr:PfkB family carbohydrate kinase [Acidimicrobiia bacterium]MDH3470024.1 PfkB family carbohydrate kinase [Acidimicrobiia bacterium]
MRVLAAGTIMVDVMAVELPSVAAPGEVIYTAVDTHIGGHPIDVAIDLVKLGRAAEEVAVAAAVGNGPFGSFVREVMDEYGISTFLQDVPNEDTGRNLVLEVSGEDRRFHLDPGANWLLSVEHISSALAAWKPDLLTLRPGYTGIDLALPEILAPLKDTVIFLDIMQPHPDRPPHFVRDALPFVDLLHCNEGEALINTGARTMEAAVEEFLDAGVKLVLVTDGEQGARAFTGSWEVAQSGFRVDSIDATGCGDAFCAGVLLFLDEHGLPPFGDLGPDELTELLISGQAVGASASTAVGCIEGVSAETTTAILAEQGNAVRQATQTNERQGRRT